MTNVLEYSAKVYATHLPLISLFSISFIVAFLIPSFAAFPTYNDAGGIFLRSASIFSNLTVFTTAIIVFSTLFSLLFLSFAIVAINIIVKHSRTLSKMRKEVVNGLEKYTATVFLLLLLYMAIIVGVDIINYYYNITPALSALIAIVITPLFFYAPASIVIDDNTIVRAIRMSTTFFFKRLDYVAIWVVLSLVLITVFDYATIAIAGTALSRGVLLIINSIFILPFLVVLQSQSYMQRFSLLKG